MDLERAMEFLLEQQAALTTQTTAQQARFDARLEAQRMRFDAEMAQSRAEFDERHRRLEGTLRRAIRISVEEHRRERVRRQELDARLTGEMQKLAIAQTATEESLKAFIDSMKRPRNGHDAV